MAHRQHPPKPAPARPEIPVPHMSLTLRLTLIAVLVLIVGALPAHAEDEPATPEHCAGISYDVERLACYDAMFKRDATSTRAADAAATAAAEAMARTIAEQKLDSTPPAPEVADELPFAPERTRIKQWLASLRGSDADPKRLADSSEIVPLDDPVSALANAGRGSLLDSRWELARDSKFGVFNLRTYKPIYALPLFAAASSNPLPQSPNPNNVVTAWHDVQQVESKLQLSFKTKIAQNLFGDNGDLWGAYTQTSRWQLFNGDESRPFRETNYEPELMLVFRNRYHLAGWNGRMATIGINHQSNGQGDPQSRSWNRIIAAVGLDRENWALVIRPWWRIPEGNHEDNNPDIEDYMGRADALLVWRKGAHEVSTIARHSLRSGERSHGSLQLDWGFPLDGPLRGHVQVFSGYGESLIDYNHASTYIGIGISLTEWF